jgi:hypothetical protein
LRLWNNDSVRSAAEQALDRNRHHQPAIGLIRHRLRDTYGDDIEKAYQVIGEPVSAADAAALAVSSSNGGRSVSLGLVQLRKQSSKSVSDESRIARAVARLSYPSTGDTHKANGVASSPSGLASSPRDLRFSQVAARRVAS